MRTKLFSIVAGLALFGIPPLQAQEYPSKVITMIVPLPRAGRRIPSLACSALPMTKALKQQVIVENVGGAGGTIGANRVAKATPDGYTLLMHHIGMSTAPALYRKLPYDPINDFEPIGLINDVPMTIIAQEGLSAEGLQGVPRLHQGQQGQGDLRQRRHRRGVAPVRHAVHERDPDRPDHGSL